MLTLIFAESSLELVPKNLRNHPSVISHARKLDKRTNQILLDNSWHFAAMKGMQNEIKRGRPDLIHASLQNACSTPLFLDKKLRIFVHTINDQVISLSDDIRLPKSYHRFAGLMEKLFVENTIETDESELLSIENMTFSELIEDISPQKVIGFSTEGKSSNCQQVATQLDDQTCIVIGGFQKGHFEDSTKSKINELFRIDQHVLEAHIVVSRILYEYEKTIFM